MDNGVMNVVKNLNTFKANTARRAGVIMGYVGDGTVVYAKRGAPWRDRTGDARRSIHSESDQDGVNITVSIGIGVYYGLYLELDYGGRYRIVDPAVFGYGKAQMQTMLKGLM